MSMKSSVSAGLLNAAITYYSKLKHYAKTLTRNALFSLTEFYYVHIFFHRLFTVYSLWPILYTPTGKVINLP